MLFGSYFFAGKIDCTADHTTRVKSIKKTCSRESSLHANRQLRITRATITMLIFFAPLTVAGQHGCMPFKSRRTYVASGRPAVLQSRACFKIHSSSNDSNRAAAFVEPFKYRIVPFLKDLTGVSSCN